MSEIEKVEQKYDESKIQVLEGLEAVRKRPGMYIGSTSASGLHHLVYEIVDNSIDEALAGFCTHIEVTINADNTVTVSDNGRGIPTGPHPKLKISTLEVVFTVLHAGGKFGGGGYKVAGGLHGVGASVVNALSEWLSVRVYNEGKIHEMEFARGKTKTPMHIVGDTDKTGTTVTFKPDPEVFDELVFDYGTLLERLRDQAYLNAGITITLTDKRGSEERQDVMCYEGGLREFVDYQNESKTPLHEQVIYFEGKQDTAEAMCALQWTDAYSENCLSFANNIRTPEGGMHETGLKAAVTRVINDYGHEFKILKPEEKLSGDDTREGLTCIISVRLEEAQFEGQTKTKLGNPYIRSFVDQLVYDKVYTFFVENPKFVTKQTQNLTY